MKISWLTGVLSLLGAEPHFKRKDLIPFRLNSVYFLVFCKLCFWFWLVFSEGLWCDRESSPNPSRPADWRCNRCSHHLFPLWGKKTRSLACQSAISRIAFQAKHWAWSMQDSAGLHALRVDSSRRRVTLLFLVLPWCRAVMESQLPRVTSSSCSFPLILWLGNVAMNTSALLM